MTNIDSDITVHPEPEAPLTVAPPEPSKVYEIRNKLTDDRPRYWTGTDFSPKAEEAVQYATQSEAEEERAGLRAGAYVVIVGL